MQIIHQKSKDILAGAIRIENRLQQLKKQYNNAQKENSIVIPGTINQMITAIKDLQKALSTLERKMRSK